MIIMHVAIATHLDGTSPRKNTFSYTCPQVSGVLSQAFAMRNSWCERSHTQVTPHAPIYFYQFSSSSTSNKTWTGRFTITNSTNSVVDPPESTQPDGEEIPWGRGSLVRASSASAGSGSAARSGTRTASAPSIQRGSPLVSPGYAGFGSVAQSGTLMSSTPSIASGSPLLSALQSNTPALSADTPGASGTVSAAEANGAVATLFASNVLVKSGLALVLAALGFTAVF